MCERGEGLEPQQLRNHVFPELQRTSTPAQAHRRFLLRGNTLQRQRRWVQPQQVERVQTTYLHLVSRMLMRTTIPWARFSLGCRQQLHAAAPASSEPSLPAVSSTSTPPDPAFAAEQAARNLNIDELLRDSYEDHLYRSSLHPLWVKLKDKALGFIQSAIEDGSSLKSF